MNTKPKYVVSTTLTDPQWAGTTVLSGDVAAAVGGLRAEPGGELQVWGRGTIVRWLLDHRLVDEIVQLTYPVIVGQGTRLFPATGPDTGLESVDLQSTPKGLTIQIYRTTGRPRYARPRPEAYSSALSRFTISGMCGRRWNYRQTVSSSQSPRQVRAFSYVDAARSRADLAYREALERRRKLRRWL